MNLPVRSSTLDPLVALQQARRLCIPSTADVRDAVALIPKPAPRPSSRFGHRATLQSPRVYEGPKWFLDVAPGLVRIRKKLTAEKVNIWDNDGVGDEERSTRGRVTGWSEKSRNRMMQTLESLDYHPMFESGEPAAMVTLTLPGEGDLWERLVPDAPTFKKMVNKFVTSYAMAWGEPLRGVWKMEFQKRGAPHLHILMVPPARDRRAGIRFVNAGKREDHQLPFSNWAGAKWASIVGATGAARAMHQLIGVDISYSEVYRYSDPRRIGSYFAKHGSFTAKDYQNDMPAHWRAAIVAGESGGANYWGYWGLEKAVETVELQHRPSARRAAIVDGEPVMAHHDLPQAQPWGPDTGIMSAGPDEIPWDVVLTMRHLRRLARSRSFVREVTVQRVRQSTGEVYERTVRRKFSYLAGRSVGFLAVNDGPSTARDIARILHNVEGPGRQPRASYDLVA